MKYRILIFFFEKQQQKSARVPPVWQPEKNSKVPKNTFENLFFKIHLWHFYQISDFVIDPEISPNSPAKIVSMPHQQLTIGPPLNSLYDGNSKENLVNMATTLGAQAGGEKLRITDKTRKKKQLEMVRSTKRSCVIDTSHSVEKRKKAYSWAKMGKIITTLKISNLTYFPRFFTILPVFLEPENNQKK